MMDNLGSHNGKAVRQAIRSAGAKRFFLPKYSPDLNPIEQVFAKLKHLLRKAAAPSCCATAVRPVRANVDVDVDVAIAVPLAFGTWRSPSKARSKAFELAS
jgi:hypothetical protein